MLIALVMVSSAAGDFLKASASASTCPSTTFVYTATEDAAGTPIWQPSPPMSLAPGECTTACPTGKSGGVKAIRMCGPGTFTLSRMSCDRHDYKQVVIEQPEDQ